MFGFGKTYTQVFLRFSAATNPESLANTGFSGLRHLAASSVKIIQSGFVPPVLKTIRAVMSTRVRILHPPPKIQSTSGFARLWTLFFKIQPGFCFKVLSKIGVF